MSIREDVYSFWRSEHDLPVYDAAARGGGSRGADARIRTGDLRITNALLYQLSYTGLGRII